jgi:hypothetical protein
MLKIYMEQSETKTIIKNYKHFVCDICNYKCNNKSNYKTHLATIKHNMKQNETNSCQNNFIKLYCQNCIDSFNSRTTLWRHKKKCQTIK